METDEDGFGLRALEPGKLMAGHYIRLGTMANITLRQPKDGEYLADIKLEDSRVNLGKNSPAPDKEKDKEKPEEFKPDSIVTFTTEITVSMALGKVVPIKVNQEWEKTGTRQVLVYLRIKNS